MGARSAVAEWIGSLVGVLKGTNGAATTKHAKTQRTTVKVYVCCASKDVTKVVDALKMKGFVQDGGPVRPLPLLPALAFITGQIDRKAQSSELEGLAEEIVWAYCEGQRPKGRPSRTIQDDSSADHEGPTQLAWGPF
jgi:hypothetical protein